MRGGIRPCSYRQHGLKLQERRPAIGRSSGCIDAAPLQASWVAPPGDGRGSPIPRVVFEAAGFWVNAPDAKLGTIECQLQPIAAVLERASLRRLSANNAASITAKIAAANANVWAAIMRSARGLLEFEVSNIEGCRPDDS